MAGCHPETPSPAAVAGPGVSRGSWREAGRETCWPSVRPEKMLGSGCSPRASSRVLTAPQEDSTQFQYSDEETEAPGEGSHGSQLTALGFLTLHSDPILLLSQESRPFPAETFAICLLLNPSLSP